MYITRVYNERQVMQTSIQSEVTAANNMVVTKSALNRRHKHVKNKVYGHYLTRNLLTQTKPIEI